MLYILFGSIVFSLFPAIAFHYLENWKFLDAWYFTIITLTTGIYITRLFKKTGENPIKFYFHPIKIERVFVCKRTFQLGSVILRPPFMKRKKNRRLC